MKEVCMSIESLWGYKTTANYLAMTTNALKIRVFRRTIPFLRISPRGVRFRKSDLDAWLNERKVEANP